MANINFGILDTQSPAKIGNAFIRTPEQQNANMLQAMQMQQLMDQREQAQYALGKSRREETGLAAFGEGLRALGPDPSEDAVAQLFIKHPNPTMQQAGVEMLQKARAQAGYRALPPMGGAPAARPTAAPAPGSFGENMLANRAGLPSFGDNQPAVNAGSFAPAAPRTRESRIAEIQPRLALLAQFAERSPQAKAEYTMLAEEIKELRKPQVLTPGSVFDMPGVDRITAPEKPPAPPSMVAEYTFAKTPDGGGFRGSFQDFVIARSKAARPPAQPRPEQPPVAVVDPRTGKTVYVSREDALRDRMTPASATEGLAPKEIQKREAALPAATSAVNGFETKSKSFVKDLETLRDHPGLASITGIAAGRLPGLTSDGRAAQALYDKIVAKGGFQALQDLRDASKTGGALGNVSNQEGKQLTASFAAIDRRQDAADVQAAIDQAISDIEGARTRTREAYDSTYSYKNAAGQAAPAGAGKPSLDSIFGKKNP